MTIRLPKRASIAGIQFMTCPSIPTSMIVQAVAENGEWFFTMVV